MEGLKKWLTDLGARVARPVVAAPLGVLIGLLAGSLGVPAPVVDAIQAVVRALYGS